MRLKVRGNHAGTGYLLPGKTKQAVSHPGLYRGALLPAEKRIMFPEHKSGLNVIIAKPTA